ncbi:MAG: hypothetical protein WCD18_19525 [Thermosynechococcaceae cyanobacterium]
MTVAVGEIIQNAVLFDLKNWSNTVPDANSLNQSVELLFKVLSERGIDYLLVGGVALLSYVEGRNTQDIGFIVSRSALATLPELVITEENRDFARGNFWEVQIDLWLTSNALFELVQKSYATERQFGNLKIRTVTVEGLIVLKLYALPSLYRQGKFDKVSIYETDILLLLLEYEVDIGKLLKLVSSYILPSDFNEIEQVIEDIQKRKKRFRLDLENEPQPDALSRIDEAYGDQS